MRLLPLMSGEEKKLCYVHHPDVTSNTSILKSSMEHCGLVLILKSMLLCEQHGRETSGGLGQLGQTFHLRRRISGGMPLLLPSVAASARTEEITGLLRTSKTLTGKQLFRGKKMHKHGAGPRCFVNIEHKMTVEEGEPPSYTALARKTHTGKDGSFLDERTEELVLEVEQAVEEMLQEESPLGDSQTDSTAATNSKRFLINQEYIKLVIGVVTVLRGQTKKGTVYGLGSVQYKNTSPSMPIPVSLQRNLDLEMRMTGFETTISEVKADINAFKTEFKEGMSANSATLDIICKLSDLKLPLLLPQLHNHFSLKLSHNLNVSPKL
ncbi:hypothetical protein Bca101_068095 [Brassica carinata]